MSTQQVLKSFNYIVHDVSLNEVKEDYKILLDSPIVYITNVPIAMDGRINSLENDKFKLTTVQIIKTTPEDPIEALFITTSTTSTENLQIITSDVDIFSDIGIEDRAVLVDSSGVEYDSRVPKLVNGTFFDGVELRADVTQTQDISYSGYKMATFDFISTLDENIVIQIFGTRDGTVWHQIGSDITIASGGNQDYATLSEIWEQIRITGNPAGAPTSGEFTIGYQFAS